MSIKPKQKQCKGTTAETKGFGCGKTTFHRVHGLGKMCGCYSDWLLNSEAGKIKTQKAIIKAQKPRKDFEQYEATQKEEKSLTASKINTRMQVHAYVRKRDYGKPCASCDCAWNDKFQAGHFFKAELYETLRYNLDNIHGQCYRCNIHVEDGNHQEYSLRLPQRIGQERYNELVRRASIDKQFSKVWDLENLKEVRDEIKSIQKNKC